MSNRIIHVAHSPDSDDAFMFYALAEGMIETPGLEFRHVLADIETLNRRALAGELEVTAVSIHAYAYLADRYVLLPHGASMGEGYGPRIVAREPLDRSTLAGRKVAVPGTLTSAYLALRLFQPHIVSEVVPFHRIIEHVAEGGADAGVVIHEGQLTFQDAGLVLVEDLGRWWHEDTGGLPLPLGGNVIRRDLGPELVHSISGYIRRSISYALQHPDPALDYAMRFARGLPRESAREFVAMYVNARTLDYGADGRRAVQLFLDRGFQAGVLPHRVPAEFAD